jgi:glycosyltransferase involved in cell wall biosynthesis
MTPRPRILLVLHHCPLPVTGGAHQRDLLLYEALAAIGEVRTIVFSYDPVDASVEQALRERVNLLALQHSPSPVELGLSKYLRRVWPTDLRSVVERLPWKLRGLAPCRPMIRVVRRAMADHQFDAVVIRPHILAMRLIGIDRARCLVDIDDLMVERHQSRLEHDASLGPLKQMVLRYDLALCRIAQKRALAYYQHGWIATPQHEPYVRGRDYAWLPNIPYCLGPGGPPAPLPPQASAKTLLFVGALWYQINREGVQHFIRQVWPRIREAVPEARLRIVGKPLAGDDLAWADVPGVEAVGFAEDLVAEYRQCAFTVAPIYGGSGTNIKVLESLAYQRAAALTPFALRGYEKTLIDGQSVRVGHDDASLAAACVELLLQPRLRQTLAERGAAVVAEHFHFDTFCRSVAEQVERIVQ